MRRQVGFTLNGNGEVEQRLPQFGGVKGEHNATKLSITVTAESFYQDGDVARLEFYAGDGTALSSDILETVIVEGTRMRVEYDLPKMLTMLGGQLCIRLVLSRMDDDGNEVETFRSGEMVLWFEDAHVENGTPFWTGVSEMLVRTVSAKDTAVAAEETVVACAQTATQMKASAQDSADRAAMSAQEAIAAKNAAMQSCATASAASAQAVSAENRANNAATTAEEQADASAQSASESSASARRALEAQDAAAASASEAKTAASEAKTAANEAGNAADRAVADYFEKNPIETGATAEQVEKLDTTASLLAAHITNSTKAVTAKLDKSGHAANKYLATDVNGNVVTVDAPKNEAYSLTDQDKTEIVNAVAESIGVPVFGTVGEDKTITLNEELPEGVYTVRYLGADGYADIGTITVGAVTPDEPSYVNLVPTALAHTDLSTVFDGVGYKDGVRVSSSSPFTSAQSGYVTVGAIPVAFDTVLYIKGVTIPTTDNNVRFAFARVDPSNANGLMTYVATKEAIATHCTLETLGDQYYKVTFNAAYLEANCPLLQYFFFSAIGSGEALIVATTPIE